MSIFWVNCEFSLVPLLSVYLLILEEFWIKVKCIHIRTYEAYERERLPKLGYPFIVGAGTL